AEDGIRDRNVTGVQTCALPISIRSGADMSPVIDSVAAETYEIPTDRPEADGTLAWSTTTLVLVRVSAGGRSGLGYTYAAPACRKIGRASCRERAHDRIVAVL